MGSTQSKTGKTILEYVLGKDLQSLKDHIWDEDEIVALWQSYDLNKDQQLDKKECNLFLNDLFKRWIKQVEKEFIPGEQDSGILTAYKKTQDMKANVDSETEMAFAKMDQDKNGVVDFDEFRTWLVSFLQERFQD